MHAFRAGAQRGLPSESQIRDHHAAQGAAQCAQGETQAAQLRESEYLPAQQPGVAVLGQHGAQKTDGRRVFPARFRGEERKEGAAQCRSVSALGPPDQTEQQGQKGKGRLRENNQKQKHEDIVVIIFNVIHKHGYDGLVVTTLLAGAMLLVFGLCRLGSLIKFIPHPVTTGFTTGIGVLIFSSQMKDFFGLAMRETPPEFFAKWEAYCQHASTFSPATLGVALLSLTAILAVRRFIPRIPGPVVGVVLASVAVWVFGLDVETIGSRFGGIPAKLPTLVIPQVTMEQVRLLLPDAMTIALLAGIESLLSCVVADGMTGDKHNSNVELTAQGAANIASVLFGGIPATGAIARTVINIRSGGQTSVVGMVHVFNSSSMHFMLTFSFFKIDSFKKISS